MPLRQDPLLEKLEPIRRLRLAAPLRYGLAFVAVGLAVLLRFALGDAVGIGTFLTFYPAVILATVLGRFAPGLLASGLSIFAADYFLVPPTHSLALTAGQAIALLLFGLNLVIVVAVIGALHELLDRLKRQESNMRFVIEAQPVGLIAVDAAGTITLVNEVVERQFGYSRSDLIGQKIEVLVSPRCRKLHTLDRNHFMEKPTARPMGAGRDLYGLRKDGTEVPVEVGLSPIKREGKKGALATIVDVSERKAAERREQALIHEVQHRSRNLLTIVQAVVTKVLATDRSNAEAGQMLTDVIAALSRTQELFFTTRAIPLGELIARECEPYSAQTTLAGPKVCVKPTAAQSFCLIVHELCVNAVKHGAFSVSEGGAFVDWALDNDTLTFTWSELNGPPCEISTRKGFGKTILFELPRAMGAEVTANYEGPGLRYTLKISAAAIAETDSSARDALVA